VNAHIKTFVIDDEPLALRRLERLLRADSDIEVVGTYDSTTAAAIGARDLSPQLLVLDIRMPELDGFALVSALSKQGINPYVIFVTAHPDRSIEAFAVGAIDYLLKPFDGERLARAVSRAKVLLTPGEVRRGQQGVEHPSASLMEDPTRLLLSERGSVVVLSLKDIEFMQAFARHVKIYAAGHCYVCHQSLGELERRLANSTFVRVHRSTVINIQHLVQMYPTLHGDYEIRLKRGTRLTLSRRYRDRLSPFILTRAENSEST
jgi:two-component system LytT family response regulator